MIDVNIEIKKMRIKDIVPAPYNPRKINEEERKALKHSLARFGLVEPLVVNRRTGFLISGHQRFVMLKEDGVREVPVVIVDLPEAEEKALNITMNNRAVGGEWEFLKLTEQLEELENELPDAYDQLLMFSTKDDVDGSIPGTDKKKYEGIGTGKHPEMELHPYESYDYVTLVFRDSRDFMRIVELLGIKNVNYSFTEKKRIGLGRCVDGSRVLSMLMKGGDQDAVRKQKKTKKETPTKVAV